MSKCINCLHYQMCIYNNSNKRCPCFTDRSEWVKLPCKVGDKVYCIYQNPATCKYSFQQREIFLIEFKDNHFYCYATPSICYKDTEFGKSVFLTREEAEKAIEKIKRESKKDKNDFK